MPSNARPRAKRRRLDATWFQTEDVLSAGPLAADPGMSAPDNDGLTSLHDYLAQRLRQPQDLDARPVDALDFADSQGPFLLIPVGDSYPGAPSLPASVSGRRLDGMDTEMNAGIEHLLPSPSIRLRIVKERLTRERIALTTRLAQYAQQYEQMKNPSPALSEQMAALESRLQIMRAHEDDVDAQLKALFLSGAPAFLWSDRFRHARQRVMRAVTTTLGLLSLDALLTRLNPKRRQRERIQAQLTDLAQMFAARQAARGAGAAEVSDIINAYDRLLTQLEALRGQTPGPSAVARFFARLLALSGPLRRMLP
ncbi:MAG: hypothetical protein IPK79_05785 [Vampirovibrionales bacterium]|nr:hypothetical protein [Vampirovibrionales bacterium]